jgi:hypothetical protein
MELARKPAVDVPPGLVDSLKSFPLQREVTHCGKTFTAPPFDFYADCPRCGARIKVRSFSAGDEIEDVFDAVFEWMNQPGAEEVVRQRQKAIQEDAD